MANTILPRLRARTVRAPRAFFALVAVLVSAVAARSAPVIITENNSTRAIAVDAVSRMRDPFSTSSPGLVGSDRRARVVFFVLNLDLLAGEPAKALSADAEDGAGKRYELTVEDVRPVPGFEGLQQVTVLLDPLMENVGDVLVRVSLHGVSSNRARITMGHATAIPSDDVGAVPQPAPQTPPAATPTPTPNQFTGAASSADAVRFLEQASWGPTSAEVARVQAMGFRAWLNEQFNAPTTSPASYTLAPTDTASGCPQTDQTQLSICQRDNYTPWPLSTRFFLNGMYGPDQLRQRVAWALHQTFVVSMIDIPYPAWEGYYVQTLDRNAFGNYRTLLGEMTLNPAMGEYLNMRGNVAANPNENYAREILQLFSVGLYQLNNDGTVKLDAQGRPLPTYDQDTITNFARVFTGWNLAAAKSYTNANGATFAVANYQDPMIVTNANNHDRCAKTLLSGFTLPGVANCTANNTGSVAFANQELSAALDNIFNHPNVGPFIGRQLIQHLVTSNPSPAYVERVARVFNNDCDALYPEGCSNQRGNLRAVVTAVLLDPEARGDVKTDPKYGRLREPAQYLNNMLRAFDAHSAFDQNQQSDGVLGERSSVNFPQVLDQRLYLPPTVFSYYTPQYEVPGTGLTGPAFQILSTTTTLQRANVADRLIYTGVPILNAESGRLRGTALYFTAFEQQASNPDQMVESFNALLMHGTMTAAMKAQVLAAVNAIPTSDSQFARKRARAAAYLVMTAPQYQVQR
jgi:uncharacterized protein (DUF1800 family)